MNKEKQIEEIVKLFMNIPKHRFPEGFTYRPYVLAEALYNAGYRKQSEGEWLIEGDMFKEYVCSVCGYSVDSPYQKTPFCPNCGSKMKGGDGK